MPRGAALCALCLVPPSEAAGIVGEGGATLLISRQAREGRAVSAALTLGQRDANFPRDLSEILTRSNAAVTASWDFSDKQQTKEWTSGSTHHLGPSEARGNKANELVLARKRP